MYSLDKSPILTVAPRIPSTMIQALQRVGSVRTCDGSPRGLRNSRVYVSTSLDSVDADFIDAMPQSLGLIANVGATTENIDLAAAAKCGVHVSNTPVTTNDTADIAMALILSACRQHSRSERLLRDGNFAESVREPGFRVNGKTIGIVGLGAVGQAVARRAAAFDLTVLYHGPHRKRYAEGEVSARYVEDLADLLGASDIVSLHCPLNDNTRRMINSESIAQMKAGAVLVNSANAGLVDQLALADSLLSGRMSGAGLCVFESEPEVSPHLRNLDNVTLLPQASGTTVECRREMSIRAIHNIRAYIEKGQILDPCLIQTR